MKIKSIELGKIILCLFLIVNTSCNNDDDDDESLSNNNFIISFKLTNNDFSKDFEIKDSKIEGVVPYVVDEANISLTIDISNKATITPDPNTIKSIKNPINFVVTAENGEKKNYVVDIKRELNVENSIISFNIKTDFFETNADIDNNGGISSRVLPNTDLKSLKTLIVISHKATITPDPETISDYTSPVTFTVTSESGERKEYLVAIQLMDEDYTVQCDIMDAFKWFGGDDRVVPDYPEIGPRNVGTGQIIKLEKDLYPIKFGFFLRDAFKSFQTNTDYIGDLELKLHLRNEDGTIKHTLDTKLIGPFNGGWIDFDLSSLNLLLKNNERYYFTWYLVDGEALGITSGSSGDANPNVDPGICGNIGLSGTSRKRENTSLEDWDMWHEHPWHFNFKFEGKQ